MSEVLTWRLLMWILLIFTSGKRIQLGYIFLTLNHSPLTHMQLRSLSLAKLGAPSGT
jgi:hypothetical protein